MILDEQAVHDLLKMEDLIPAMAKAMADLSSGKVVQPPRVMMPIAEHQGFLGLMPAYGGALGAKLVAFYPNNQGVPSHHATILLFRPETGEPLVSMDGRLITEMRTAAVSAVATQHLARADAAVLGILGAGVQARSHLQAMRLVRKFRDVRRRSGAGRRRRRRGDDVPDARAARQMAGARRARQRGRGAAPDLARAG